MTTTTQTIETGDMVRSLDFEHIDNCYVEGTVVGQLEPGEKFTVESSGGEFTAPCPVYVIECTRKVWDGVESANRESHYFPPVNGTPSMLGGPTNFVSKI